MGLPRADMRVLRLLLFLQFPTRTYIANLDSMPIADRAAIDLGIYLNAWKSHHGASLASLFCARACPYHCTWCSHTVYGETHRRRSPENVADEVEFLRDTYHPDMLWYADDVFTINTRWFYRYADELKRRGIKLPFECITRGDRMNPHKWSKHWPRWAVTVSGSAPKAVHSAC